MEITHKQAMELAIEALRREIEMINNSVALPGTIEERQEAIKKLETKIRTMGY